MTDTTDVREKPTEFIIKTQDREEMIRLLQAPACRYVLWSVLNANIRAWLKYGHSFKSPEEALEGVREAILTGLDEQGIMLE